MAQQFTIEQVRDIVAGNAYIQRSVSNPRRDPSSLSSIIDRQLSQSDAIKMGHALEHATRDIVKRTRPDLTDIRPTNREGMKERDHLFVDPATRTVHYGELKTNLNLDTEKSLATRNKCVQIETELKAEYPNHEIKMYLVGARYMTITECSTSIRSKYAVIGANVVGVNDYFAAIGVPFQFADEAEYRGFVNFVADRMFG
jgi:hypothetical protein